MWLFRPAKSVDWYTDTQTTIKLHIFSQVNVKHPWEVTIKEIEKNRWDIFKVDPKAKVQMSFFFFFF